MEVHSKWSFISIQNLLKMSFRLFHPANAHPSTPASPSRYHPPHGPRLHGASLPGLQHYLPPNWCTSNRWWLPRLPIFCGKMGDVAKKGWTNMAKLDKHGTFNFSFGGVGWKKVELQHGPTQFWTCCEYKSPKKERIWNFTMHWWIDGRWDSEVESDTRHLNLVRVFCNGSFAQHLAPATGRHYLFCLGGFHLQFDWNTGNTSAVCS